MLLAQTKSTVSPKVFVAFLKSVLLYPRGSMLRLSTGEIAQPVDFPLHLPTRPTVVVTHNSHGDEVIGRAQRTINLAEHTEITIDAYTIVEETTKGAQETQQENTARSFISRLR
jgi:cell fate regulator YaaT (PSP1 superfamily)